MLLAMTQKNILELAKLGKPEAIAALINRQLQSIGIIAKANFSDVCLIIMLQSFQVLYQKLLLNFIQTWI